MVEITELSNEPPKMDDEPPTDGGAPVVPEDSSAEQETPHAAASIPQTNDDEVGDYELVEKQEPETDASSPVEEEPTTPVDSEPILAEEPPVFDIPTTIEPPVAESPIIEMKATEPMDEPAATEEVPEANSVEEAIVDDPAETPLEVTSNVAAVLQDDAVPLEPSENREEPPMEVKDSVTTPEFKTVDESATAVEELVRSNESISEDSEVVPETVPTAVDEPIVGTKPPSSDSAWTEYMGSDLVMKVMEEGVGPDIQPHDGVVIDFVGRYAKDRNQDDGPVFQTAENWLVVVGDKDVVPALEMGVRFMKGGSRSVIWSHSKYSLGLGTRTHDGYELPPLSNVRYEVHVKQVVPAEELGTVHRMLEVGASKKQIANDVYAHEWPEGASRAIYIYSRCAKEMSNVLLISELDESDASYSQAREIQMDCLNNVVAVHLRAKEWNLAKKAAVEVLKLDPHNFKGLIRAAKAALMDPASSYEEVDAAIQAAAEQSASVDNTDLQRLRVDFKRRKLEYEKKSKEMFGKIGKANEKEDNTSDEQEEQEPAIEQPEPASEQKLDVEKTVDEETATENATWLSKVNWSKVLPYVFQISMSIGMLLYFQYLRQQQAEKEGTDPSKREF